MICRVNSDSDFKNLFLGRGCIFFHSFFKLKLAVSSIVQFFKKSYFKGVKVTFEILRIFFVKKV